MKQDFVEDVISWFNKNGRNYPWRETDSPYRVLVAEVMLQKTSASQVICVYNDFIDKYPGPQELSEGKVKVIKNMIKPLGLHKTRSERLKELGESLVNDFSGEVPQTKEELLKLPGVGEYVSSAVLCMAFEKEELMADANFGRVIGRLINRRSATHPYDDIIGELRGSVQIEDFRRFNLGVIDLGALICRPENPKCNKCPLNEHCSCT